MTTIKCWKRASRQKNLNELSDPRKVRPVKTQPIHAAESQRSQGTGSGSKACRYNKGAS